MNASAAPLPRRTAIALLLLAAVLAAGCEPAEEVPDAAMSIAPDVEERLATFAPMPVAADLSDLAEGERQVLERLIEAARHMDEIFKLQAWPEAPAFRERLARERGPQAKAALAFFDIMYGPWDRQRDREPFVGDPPAEEAGGAGMQPWPKGAGYYPDDLTEAELDAYLEANPDRKNDVLGLYTVVRREGEDLAAVPYSVVYREHLESAAALLRDAADLTDNETLRRFLELRAEAFLADDYYESEKAWMELDSPIEVTIGPYEVYEDELKAAKTAFEAFVTIQDPEASRDLARFKDLLPDMERHLPIPDDLKTERGAESPIRVVDLVFSGGDTRAGVQTIAFNLPNDERIRAEKGSKKVLLRNVMNAKYESILKPIAAEVMNPAQLGLVTAEGFFNETLFHELAHGLGPAYVTGQPGVEVRQALESLYSSLEEGKADVMGAYNILYMVDRGLFPDTFRDELLISYFAGLFRSVRFGTSAAHGRGAAVQLNWHLEHGGASQGDDGRFTVDLEALEASIEGLVREMCLIQAAGDKERAGDLLDGMGLVTPPIEQALARLGSVPVDIRPVYTDAGETMPQER
jgi:hypothetical protein